jgi:peroxiredoxin
MKKAKYFLPIILFICILMSYGITAATSQAPETDETIRISLSRNDDYINAIFHSLTFDKDRVEGILEKYKVKLPEELPAGAQLGYASSDETMVILQEMPGKDAILLTVDANRNYDLNDDEGVMVPKRIERDDGVIIKIKKTYEGPPAKEVWLPYRFSYYTRQDSQGKSEDTVLRIANYRMEGTFQVNGKDYYFYLHDFNTRGVFDKSNLSRGTVVSTGPVEEGEKMDDHYWGYELIPVENDFYEISDFALDGSWIELKKSHLPRASLGKPAPDFPMTDLEAKAFRMSDFKGRVVLLDFWASWCKPCISKFPDIKKMIEQYPSDELKVIGINVDTASRIELAKKVIADYELPWQQNMEGKGYFLPIYQVFGLLPENKMTCPVYIVIDAEGIVRYATNDYTNAERSLDKLLNRKGEPSDILLPMKKENRERAFMGSGVMFTQERVKKVVEENQVKLPENLSPDARVGMMRDKTIVIVKNTESPDILSIIVDTDRDNDLTNDEEKEIKIPKGREDPEQTRIYLKTTYPDEGWEYYPLLFFAPQPRDNSAPPYIYYGLGYAFKTTFFQDGKEYQVTIQDPTMDGTFKPADIESQNFINLAVKKGDKWEYIHTGYELIPIGKEVYRADAVAEDARWIELKKSALKPAAIGRPAPDFEMADTEGETFRISDLKGTAVLLDFWPSWCKPCIAKFPDIKKLIQQYSEEKLTVVGINLDEPERVELAHKVIAEYQLPWRQVVEGKGYSNPAYQVYGRLPEHMMVFPVYIVIDEEGIVRYATNDYQKVERILNKLLIAPSGGKDTLLIPLSRSSAVEEKLNPPVPIDFSARKLKKLMESQEVKLPDNLGEESRIGMMPNETLIIAQPTADPEKILLTVDANRDYDLTNEKPEEIPVVEEWKSDKDPCTEIVITISRSSGGKSFYTFRFFAQKQDIYYHVRSMRYTGSFFHGDQEYAITLTDPTSDGIITPEDLENKKILELKAKKDDEWVPVYTGMAKLPIGGSLFRVTDVCPDADWVELVKIR